MNNSIMQKKTSSGLAQSLVSITEEDLKLMRAFYQSSVNVFDHTEIIISEHNIAVPMLEGTVLPVVAWKDIKGEKHFEIKNGAVKAVYFLISGEEKITPEMLKCGSRWMKAGKRVYCFSLPSEMPSIGHFINLNSPDEFKKLMANANSIVDFIIMNMPAEPTKARDYIKVEIAPVLAAHPDYAGIYVKKIAKSSGVPRSDVANILHQAVMKKRGIHGFSINEQGRLVARALNLKQSVHSVQDALITLNELSKWFAGSQAIFSLITKWLLLSPFAYVKKQLKKPPYQWLLLLGLSGVGKTTLAQVGAFIWNIEISKYETSAATIGTVAGLSKILSGSSLPVLVNEAAELFENKMQCECIKNAWDSPTVRSVIRGQSFYEQPSLAPLILTANKSINLSAALKRRFRQIDLPLTDKPSRDQVKKFRAWMPNLKKLSPIGGMVFDVVKQDSSILDTDDFETTGADVLEKLYSVAGLDIPTWVELRLPVEGSDDACAMADMSSEIITILHGYVIDLLKGVSRLNVDQDNNFGHRLDRLMSCRTPTDVLLYKEEVIIKKGFLEYANKKGCEISSLSNLAELLGGVFFKQASIRPLQINALSIVKVSLSKIDRKSVV